MLPVTNSPEAIMASGEGFGYVPDVRHPEVMRGILERILATGDVIGRDARGRAILAVAVDDWLLDELAAFGADLDELEPEPDEEDDPTEDGEA
jgi:hypothetical protein